MSTVIATPPTTESNPPPPAVEDIVKLGYVPVIVVPPAPVNATVWSGWLFVTVTFPVGPLTDIPVPAIIESTAPLPPPPPAEPKLNVTISIVSPESGAVDKVIVSADNVYVEASW